MGSPVKRQDIFKDINPLIKIYAAEDAHHYITKEKRKQIKEFMGKDNVVIKHEYMNEKQEKVELKERFQREIGGNEIREAVDERIKNGIRIKNSHAKDKIHFGNDKNTIERKEQENTMNPEEVLKDYAKKREFADNLKTKLRQSNFFLGKSPPIFERKGYRDQFLLEELSQLKSHPVSPGRQQNHSSIKIAYDSKTPYSKDNVKFDSININKMNEESLSKTQRPQLQAYLKKSSINFTSSIPAEDKSPKNPFNKRAFSTNYSKFQQEARNSRTSIGYKDDDLKLEMQNSSNNLKICKELKERYDHSPKNHLTQGIGQTNQFEYQSLNKSFHKEIKEIDSNHQEEIRQLKKTLLSTSYQIGRSNVSNTLDSDRPNRMNITQLKTKPQTFRNPNLVVNLDIKSTAQKVDSQMRFSTTNGFYNSTFQQRATSVQLSPLKEDQLKQRLKLKQDLLSHAFQLGYDSNGGVNIDQGDKPLKTFIPQQQQEKLNKPQAERQNFTISQNIGKFIESDKWNRTQMFQKAIPNQINTDVLKRSNIPFGMNSPKTAKNQQLENINEQPSSPQKANIFANYQKIKTLHGRSNVPFSVDQRKNSPKKADDSFQSFYTSQYNWNTPKYF